jgi:electron transport complex protein RnfA
MNSIALAVLSGFFLNLPLHFGIGVSDIYAEREARFLNYVLKALILFFTLLLQWLLFALVFSPMMLGFFKYFLLLPVGAFFPLCLRFILQKIFPKLLKKEDVFVFSYGSGASIAACLIMLSIAGSLAEALVIASGFSGGTLFSMLLLSSILFRVEREKVTSLIRGFPLMLIAMGILALALSAAAIMYLQ